MNCWSRTLHIDESWLFGECVDDMRTFELLSWGSESLFGHQIKFAVDYMCSYGQDGLWWQPIRTTDSWRHKHQLTSSAEFMICRHITFHQGQHHWEVTGSSQSTEYLTHPHPSPSNWPPHNTSSKPEPPPPNTAELLHSYRCLMCHHVNFHVRRGWILRRRLVLFVRRCIRVGMRWIVGLALAVDGCIAQLKLPITLWASMIDGLF